MKIVLDAEDFGNLSKMAKDEILKQILGSEYSHQADVDEDLDGPAELTPFLAKKFMEGVGDTTKDLLKVFAENNGRASYSQLLAACAHDDWRKLRGFFSGVTRRARGILNDPDTLLLVWDEDKAEYDEDGELIEGEYFMSNMTTKSLRTYFKI